MGRPPQRSQADTLVELEGEAAGQRVFNSGQAKTTRWIADLFLLLQPMSASALPTVAQNHASGAFASCSRAQRADAGGKRAYFRARVVANAELQPEAQFETGPSADAGAARS